MRCEPVPARAHPGQQPPRLCRPLTDDLLIGQISKLHVLGPRERQRGREQPFQLAGEGQLIGRRQLDVDALDLVRVFAHARQRQHHILVDLEGVGVTSDGCGTRSVQPELAPRFRAHRDESLAAAGVGEPHDVRGSGRDGGRVVTDYIAEQGHLRQRAALGFGGIAHRAQVALVHVLEAREPHGAARRQAVPDSPLISTIAGIASRAWPKNSRHTVRVCAGLRVQHPARGRWMTGRSLPSSYAWQAAEELVGHVLPQPDLAELVSCNAQRLGAQRRCLVRRLPAILPYELELRCLDVVDLAPVVGDSADLQPVAVASRPCSHQARLSTAVPQSTAFLPPAFIAMLPPMQDASADVGSTANTSPPFSAATVTRRVTTPASEKIVGTDSVSPGSARLSMAPRRRPASPC